MEGTIIMNSLDTSLAFKCQVIWKEKPKGFSVLLHHTQKKEEKCICQKRKKTGKGDIINLIIVYRKVMFDPFID